MSDANTTFSLTSKDSGGNRSGLLWQITDTTLQGQVHDWLVQVRANSTGHPGQGLATTVLIVDDTNSDVRLPAPPGHPSIT